MSKYYQNLAAFFIAPLGLICPALILLMIILNENALVILNSFRPYTVRLIFTFGIIGFVGSYYKFKHRNSIRALEQNNNWPVLAAAGLSGLGSRYF